MTLQPGSTLGPYEVTSSLGAGRMREVELAGIDAEMKRAARTRLVDQIVGGS